MSKTITVKELDLSYSKEVTELLGHFFRQINSYTLDGKFKVKPRAAHKMTEVFFKLQGSGKVLIAGSIDESTKLHSIVLARIEERPYLTEEKILYIDIAYTRIEKRKTGFMSALLEFVETWAKKRKIEIIELRTLKENKDAVHYWKRKGYNDFYIRFRKTI